VLENKHFKPKLKSTAACPPAAQSTRPVLTPGNKREQLEAKFSSTQGEAKLFVFIAKTHRKEMQNTKQPKASG